LVSHRLIKPALREVLTQVINEYFLLECTRFW
jgi:hypothetical protein